MDLEQVLRDMEMQRSEKTASAPETSDERLQGALAAAVEKTAAVAPAVSRSSASPVNDLMKIANTIAGSEKEAELAHAAMLGTMFAESAVAKFASYDAQIKVAMANDTPSAGALKEAAEYGYAIALQEVAAQLGEQEKVAGDVSDDELAKLAAEVGYSDTMQKIAAEVGYSDTLEKVAAEEYQAGHDQALQDVHTAAMTEFYKGAAEVEMLVNLHNQNR